MNLVDALDKFFERLLHPETLIALATLVTAFSAWRQSREGKKEILRNTELTMANRLEIAENTKVTLASKEEAGQQLHNIHTLVNDMTTRALGREAGDKDRIAGLTGDEGDARAAERARQDYAAKLVVDARIGHGQGKGEIDA